MPSQPDAPPILVSLGTVLIDRFTWTDPSTSLPLPNRPTLERIGGGGLYALVGARIWLEPKYLKVLVESGGRNVVEDSSAWGPSVIEDADETEGRFPQNLKKQMDALGEEMWVWRKGKVLKASIQYRGDERTFKYLSPPPSRNASDLLLPQFFGAEYIHVVASPSDCLQLVHDLERLQSETRPFSRAGEEPENRIWRPKIIYEPHPKHCRAEELETLKQVLNKVHILSPNHEELAAFLSSQPSSSPYSESAADRPPQNAPRETIESYIRTLMVSSSIGPNGTGALVVRAGALGACVGTPKLGGEVDVEISWIPAYWMQEDRAEVRDVTGAGNSFLGGLVAGLHFSKGDAREAGLYASVSASYVVQQFGLPVLSRGPDPNSTVGQGEDLEVGSAEDLWNGENPWRRLEKLKRRMAMEKVKD